MTTWKRLCLEEIERCGIAKNIDGPLIFTVDRAFLDLEFETGYDDTCVMGWCAWTRNRVFFPVTYDGEVVVRSVPRHPVQETIPLIGNQ